MSEVGEDGTDHAAIERLIEIFQKVATGTEKVTVGLTSAHHTVFQFGEDAPKRYEPIGMLIRPDLDDFVDKLKGTFPAPHEPTSADEVNSVGSGTQFSQEWYARKMIGLRDMFNAMAMAAGSRSDEDLLALTMAYTVGLELGALVKEYEWKFQHEQAALEGHRHREGRKAGQPLAAQARRKAGEKRRRAIVAAAKRLIGIERNLAHNLSELARRIEAERLDELRQSDGTFLGENIIRRHLGAARKAGQFE